MVNTKMLLILLACPMLSQSSDREEYPEEAKTLYPSTEFRLSQIENHLWRLEGRLTRLRASNQNMRNELATVQRFQGSMIRDYSNKTDELNRKTDELSGYVTGLQGVLTKLLGIHVIQSAQKSDKKPISAVINQLRRDIDELKQAIIGDRRVAVSLAKKITDLEGSMRRKLGKTPNPFAVQEAEEMLRLNGYLSPKR